MGRMQDKTVIVTGGASGIGKATAILMAAEGANVVVADLRADACNAVAEEIAQSGGRAIGQATNVTEEAGWQALVAKAVESFDGFHALINNAGVGSERDGSNQDPESIQLDSWRKMNAVNLEGVALGCKYAIRHMRDSGGGAIVNTSSLAAMVATPDLAAYGAGKAGVHQYTKSVAAHCARRRYRIRCNSVHPGPIETPMVETLLSARSHPDQARDRWAKAIPMGTFGRPIDIAYGILYLASDEAQFVTGTSLVIDGGINMY